MRHFAARIKIRPIDWCHWCHHPQLVDAGVRNMGQVPQGAGLSQNASQASSSGEEQADPRHANLEEALLYGNFRLRLAASYFYCVRDIHLSAGALGLSCPQPYILLLTPKVSDCLPSVPNVNETARRCPVCVQPMWGCTSEAAINQQDLPLGQATNQQKL